MSLLGNFGRKVRDSPQLMNMLAALHASDMYRVQAKNNVGTYLPMLPDVRRFAVSTEAAAKQVGGMTGLGLGFVGLAGVGSGIGSSAKNAAFDYAFDDPNADEAFMGRSMSSAFLGSAGAYGAGGAIGVGLGASAIGGLVGGGGLAKAIPKGVRNRGIFIGAGAAVGGVLGGSVGGMGDAYDTYGTAPTAGMNVATTGIGAGIGGTVGAFAKRRIKGGLIGAAIGGLIGAAVVPGMTIGKVRSNRELLNSSPYSTSLSVAQALNASGDIVLGMHNSRSSY